MRYNRRKTTKPRRKTTKARKFFRKSIPRSVPTNLATLQENSILGGASTGYATTLDLNTPYELVQSIGTSHPRCLALCGAYEQYRITKATYRFLPRATDFAAGSPPPYIYIHKMKSGIAPTNFDANWLESMGARPRLFNRAITVSFKPQVADGIINDISGGAILPSNIGVKSFTSPWLATHDLSSTPPEAVPAISSTEHYGLLVFVAQQGNTSNAPICEMTGGITAQFRKPYTSYNTSNAFELVKLDV